MTSGFYSLDDSYDIDGVQAHSLFYAHNYVASPEYVLRRELKDTYEYPVWGWYWFDSEEEAKEFFNITD